MNNQPTEKPVDEPGRLDVVSIWETIQGEGPFAGVPSTFIRLAGCNLQCPHCDTDYTTNRRLLNPVEIVDEVRSLKPVTGIVVVTGGEPFRQNLRALEGSLRFAGLSMHVETNGTLLPSVTEQAVIITAPKTPKVHAEIARRTLAWKYVVETGAVSEEDGLPTSVLGLGLSPARPPQGTSPGAIYVQPLDEHDPGLNQDHYETAVRSCLQFGYRLSIQLHKIVGIA